MSSMDKFKANWDRTHLELIEEFEAKQDEERIYLELSEQDEEQEED